MAVYQSFSRYYYYVSKRGRVKCKSLIQAKKRVFGIKTHSKEVNPVRKMGEASFGIHIPMGHII